MNRRLGQLTLYGSIAACIVLGSLSFLQRADGGERTPECFRARGVCWTAGEWSARSLRWHARLRAERRSVRALEARLGKLRHDLRRLQARRAEPDWRAKQIAAAEVIARESAGDPWPNCGDPYDGSGSSWDDTAACENRGQWTDSPGYYRCGLQFDPGWERRFGRLCP